MRIVVPAEGTDLDAQTSAVFGRCQAYVFVDTDTMAFEVLKNPAADAPSGAGVRAAQLVVEHGARAVLSGEVGPKAADVLAAARVPVYRLRGPVTVRQAVDALLSGRLQVAGAEEGAQRANFSPAGGDGRPGRGAARPAQTAGVEAPLERLERRS